MLDRQDFSVARGRLGGLAAWGDAEEFVQERESAYFGYGAAGVRARLQTVPYAGFERWQRLTGAPADLIHLDIFAEHWLWRSENPRSPIKGIFRRDSACVSGIVGADGVQWIDIFADGFRRWRTALVGLRILADRSLTLHAYARFAVEACIGEF
jgi:hypothetical protein